MLFRSFFETNLVAETAEEKELIEARLQNELEALEAERIDKIQAKKDDAEKKDKERIDRQLADEFAIASARVSAAQNIAETLSIIAGEDEASQAALLKDRKSTRLNSSHALISYAVFCLKKKKTKKTKQQKTTKKNKKIIILLNY